MKTMEWKTIDRAAAKWPSGPWDNEPDKAQWQDEATGLPCIAVRHKSSGHWCGYVGVSEGHPAFEIGYDDARVTDDDGEETYPSVHGGLTYADFCRPHGDEHSEGICHLPEPGEPDRVWWLGFDCAHAGDCSPQDAYFEATRGSLWRRQLHDTYKSLAYVKAECALLAKQLARKV